MTNRLLIRTETQPTSTREQRAPRILVVGIIGLLAVVGLGLLAVPILVGTNAFFAATAGCSGQQTGTAGQPRRRPGQVDPVELPVLVQEGRPAVRRAVDDPGRHRHGGE